MSLFCEYHGPAAEKVWNSSRVDRRRRAGRLLKTFWTAGRDQQLPDGTVILAAYPPQTALRRDFKSETE
jgi:hypothetical protein